MAPHPNYTFKPLSVALPVTSLGWDLHSIQVLGLVPHTVRWSWPTTMPGSCWCTHSRILIKKTGTRLQPKIHHFCLPKYYICQVKSRLGVQAHTVYQGPQINWVHCGFLLFHFCTHHVLLSPLSLGKSSPLWARKAQWTTGQGAFSQVGKEGLRHQLLSDLGLAMLYKINHMTLGQHLFIHACLVCSRDFLYKSHCLLKESYTQNIRLLCCVLELE